jgi:Uncharacterized protein conserved in bacteria (DUF2213)
LLLFDSAIGKTITTRPKRFRALASRSGIFPYILGDKLVWQYRPEEEVFSDESIESFFDASITIGHPDDDLSLTESHGTVYDVQKISDSIDIEPGIYCDFVVFTDDARELASSGIPVSPMYDVLLEESSGVHDGKKYDFVQRNIRYRSLGLVSDARQEITKVFYQLSKDSNVIVSNKNIIEVPVMKTKLTDIKPLIPDTESILVSTNSDESYTTETVTTTEKIPVETESTEVIAEETPVETVNEKAIAEINSDGGVNVNKDYLDDAIDVAQRASDMGLLSFNEAMQYSLSSICTIKKMILLKEGIELSDWDDVSASYKVYMKMKPLTQQTSVNADAKGKSPILPSINHPIHQKASISKTPGYNTAKIVTFEDLE